MRSLAPLLLVVLLLGACGGESSTTPDAPANQPDANNQAQCLIKGDYGAVGALTGTAGSAQGATTVTVTLEAGTPRDTFFIRMVPGKGVFGGGLMSGTYTISGVDTSYNDCGLCVHIIADVMAGQPPGKFYFADAGSVTLSSTTAPIMGSATNLHFSEIDINTGAKVSGGCQATIDSIMFATQ
jgi:hypothetical protein